MHVLVPIKWCVDYRIHVHPSEDGQTLPTQSLKKAINPFDEIALEQAIQWQEKNDDVQITLCSLGDASVCEGLRYGLAMGGDRAIWFETPHPLTPQDTAKVLAQHVAQHDYHVILMGKQSIDADHHQTSQMLAGYLDWPQATCASEITCHETHLNITQEVDHGLAQVSCNIPCVVSTDLRLNTPRYPTLPQLMQARQKNMAHIVVSPQPAPSSDTVTYITTPQQRQTQSVDTVIALIDALQREGIL